MLRRTEKRKPGKWIWPATRKAIYIRDDYTCYWCGKKHEVGSRQLSLDHLIPWVYFGPDAPHNLVTCCRVCNSKRGDKKLQEWYQVVEKEFNKSKEELKAIMAKVNKVETSTKESFKYYRNIANGKPEKNKCIK